MSTSMTTILPSLETLKALGTQQQPTLFELSATTVLTCSGEDASTFLQGQLTCDVLKLTSSEQIVLGSCCTPNGRMVGLFYVVKYSETCFWLCTPKENAQSVLSHLGKYSVFSKVTLQENPDNITLFGLISSQELPPLACQKHLTMKLPLATQEFSLYLTTSAKAYPNLQLKSESYWSLALLLEGLPYFSTALANKYLPSDLHVDQLGGVSYNKGCYTGQEPIARLHFKGTPKFTCRVIQWKSNAPLAEQPENIYLNDKKVGSLIQAIPLVENGYLGLARLRIDAVAESQQFSISHEAKTYQAEMVKVAYNE